MLGSQVVTVDLGYNRNRGGTFKYNMLFKKLNL